MKLFTALLTAAITLSPLSVFALPVSEMKFTRGSSCGLSTSRTHWTSVTARKGQTLNVIIPSEYDEWIYFTLTNVTSGKTFDVKGEYAANGETIISEDYVLKNNGKYIVKMYDSETNEQLAGTVGICIK